MEKLINYINTLYKWSVQSPESAKTFFNQAFGAVQFYVVEHNLSGEEYTELETKWLETFRPAFEAIMDGGVEV